MACAAIDDIKVTDTHTHITTATPQNNCMMTLSPRRLNDYINLDSSLLCCHSLDELDFCEAESKDNHFPAFFFVGVVPWPSEDLIST